MEHLEIPDIKLVVLSQHKLEKRFVFLSI